MLSQIMRILLTLLILLCTSFGSVIDDACAICLESLDNDATIFTTRCQHGYHEACLSRWLASRASYPHCREPISRSSCTKWQSMQEFLKDKVISAIRLGDFDEVKRLIQRIKVTHLNIRHATTGRTMFETAIYYEQDKIVELFLSTFPGENLLKLKDKDGRSPLIQACSMRHWLSAITMVNSGKEIDIDDVWGRNLSALMSATIYGQVDLVMALLSRGPKLEIVGGTYDQTALFYAEKPEIILALLQAGADPFGRSYVNTPIWLGPTKRNDWETLSILIENIPSLPAGGIWSSAVWNNKIYIMQKLVDRFPDLDLNVEIPELKTSTVHGRSAIFQASIDGSTEMVSMLVGLWDRVDLNKRDSKGYTALLLGIIDKHISAARILIEAGADLHVSLNGFTALDFLFHANEVALVQSVIARYSETPLRYYAGMCDLGKVIEMVSIANEEERSVSLMNAVSQGCVHVVEVLLQYPMNINIQTDYGKTPLSMAVYRKQVEILRVLLKHKPGLDIPDKFGWTALMSASYRPWEMKDVEMVQMLIAAGANLNAQTIHSHETALMHAYGGGTMSIEVMQALIDAGADWDFTNAGGYSLRSIIERMIRGGTLRMPLK